jgi:hypothetical protein
MKTIELAKQKGIALVDDEDFEKLSKIHWRLSTDGYATTRLSVGMHRMVIGAKPGQQVDHINMNKLDNRKENLRLCTHSQNKMNMNAQSNSTTGYKGVDINHGRYRAQIKIGMKRKFIGYFDDPIAAAKAYDKEAVKNYGAFARTNFEQE